MKGVVPVGPPRRDDDVDFSSLLIRGTMLI